MIKYNEDLYQYNFLYATYSLPKEELKTLFNKEQLQLYKKQYSLNEVIDYKMIANKNLTIVNSYKNLRGINYIIILSKPFLSKDKKYCLIGYDTGSSGGHSGESGFTIYKKVNGKWVLYKNILMGIS